MWRFLDVVLWQRVHYHLWFGTDKNAWHGCHQWQRLPNDSLSQMITIADIAPCEWAQTSKSTLSTVAWILKQVKANNGWRPYDEKHKGNLSKKTEKYHTFFQREEATLIETWRHKTLTQHRPMGCQRREVQSRDPKRELCSAVCLRSEANKLKLCIRVLR